LVRVSVDIHYILIIYSLVGVAYSPCHADLVSASQISMRPRNRFGKLAILSHAEGQVRDNIVRLPEDGLRKDER